MEEPLVHHEPEPTLWCNKTRTFWALVISVSIIVVTIAIVLPVYYLAYDKTVKAPLPIVINTWNIPQAAESAWDVLTAGSKNAVDAIEQGCTVCEQHIGNICWGSIGYGGSPDENGETTLDAMIMDGSTMDVGAVGALRSVIPAIQVARYVMQYTTHTLLVGSQATEFALKMGFKSHNLSTNASLEIWEEWKENKCQPNYWQNVIPVHTTTCGPYHPNKNSDTASLREDHGDEGVNSGNHDTIGMIAIDQHANIASGTTTNGLNHKIPGRVGDSPIAGAGSYADNEVGACAATGDGDVMMRFLPCYQVVESMRQGIHPKDAAEDALKRIGKYYPNFQGGLIALNKDGEYGAAGWGWVLQYSIRHAGMDAVKVVDVPPIG